MADAGHGSPHSEPDWQVPSYSVERWQGRTLPWCVVIPVINEGERIRSLLSRMAALEIDRIADIIIVDGGSTDGSLSPQVMDETNVRGLLVKTGPGRLSAQLRCGYAFAVDHGYEGVVTIDGNDKGMAAAVEKAVQQRGIASDGPAGGITGANSLDNFQKVEKRMQSERNNLNEAN